MNSASRAWIASATCLRVPLIDSPINSIFTTSTTVFRDERLRSICERPASGEAAGRTKRRAGGTPRDRWHRGRRGDARRAIRARAGRVSVGRDDPGRPRPAPVARAPVEADGTGLAPALAGAAVLDHLHTVPPPEQVAEVVVELVALRARHDEPVGGVSGNSHALSIPGRGRDGPDAGDLARSWLSRRSGTRSWCACRTRSPKVPAP